jgi:hypothetical protein
MTTLPAIEVSPRNHHVGSLDMKAVAMAEAVDQRPPVAIGHVRLNVTDVGVASRWLATVGLRPIVSSSDLAVLELRGGTHLVVMQAEQPPEPKTGAPFDLMFDDVDATHRIFEGGDCAHLRSDEVAFTTRLRSSDPTDGSSPSTPRMLPANLFDCRFLIARVSVGAALRQCSCR